MTTLEAGSDNKDSHWRQEPLVSATLSSAEFNQPDVVVRSPQRLLPLLVLSLLLHGTLLLVMSTLEQTVSAPVIPAPPDSIPLRLVLVPPSEQQVEEIVAQPDPVPASGEEPLLAETPIPAEIIVAPPRPAPQTTVNVPQVPTLPPRQEPEPQPELALPSTLSLRQIVVDTDTRKHPSGGYPDCTVVQQQNPLITCAETQERDFSVLNQNSLVEYFNRQNASGQPQTGIGVMALHQTDRTVDISASGLDLSNINLFLQTLSLFEDGYFTAGDRKQAAIEAEMYANDRTFQIKQRVMNPR